MSNTALGWMEGLQGPEWYWYAKILSANDTLATGAHQAGPYIPKDVVFGLFPTIADRSLVNPRHSFSISIDSHGVEAIGTAIWYNNRTRNETRITGWGGGSSPILDPDSTGSLCVFAFHKQPTGDADYCRIWLCRDREEEETVVDRIGTVEPGRGVLYSALGVVAEATEQSGSACKFDSKAVPYAWRDSFPEAQEIVAMAVSLTPSLLRASPDDRLLKRRECEYRVFRVVEEMAAMPRLAKGFSTVDAFVAFANAVTNRRKSRSGKSLELQMTKVFDEEGLPYSHGQVSEGHKRPDFLFPSAEAYRRSSYPQAKLRMLATKTTCKDRWRQILNEADRIPTKHLLTLQEGVSENQFNEMVVHGVVLVVPRALHGSYPDSVRKHLVSLSKFISETVSCCTLGW